MNNFKKVSELLAQRAEEIAQHLLPAGKRIGNEWCVGVKPPILPQFTTREILI